MAYQLVPFMPLNVVVVALTTSLGVYALVLYLRRTRRSVLLAFSGFMFSISGWALAEFIAFAVISPDLTLLILNILNAIPAALWLYFLLWFALEYTDNRQLISAWLPALALLNVAGLSAALLVWPHFLYEPTGLVTQGPVTVFDVTFDEWLVLDRDLNFPFRLYQLYAYLIQLIVAGTFVRYISQNRSDLYTGQVAALLSGIIPPLIFNSLLFFGVIPPMWNITGVVFGVIAVSFGIAIFRYELLKTVPIGRKQLVGLLTDPVVMLNSDDRVVDSNHAARELFEVESGWKGIPANEFFDPFDTQVERIRRSDTENTDITVSNRETTAAYDVKISPITASSATGAGQVLLFSDVTEQKQREQELEETKRELEQSNEKLDQFAGVVSHDLRNPLTVILGYVRHMDGDDDNQRHVDAIERAATRMEDMINDMLMLSRSGATIEDPENVPLATVATESWETAQTDDADFDLTVKESTTVRADRDRLRHIFENIFRNAVDHNDHPLTVRVGLLEGTEATPDDGQKAGFFIEDDGDGIPADERDTVFDHGHTTSDEGTGFGLSIVRDVVDAHDWDIRIAESDEGGARFEIGGVEIDT